MTEPTWSDRTRHNIYVGMAAAPVIWVSLLIGEGARFAPAFSIGVLTAGQIVVLVSMYLAWRHFSLRQLIVLVTACAVMWAIAIPGIQKHREFTATVHGLRRYGANVTSVGTSSPIDSCIPQRFRPHRIIGVSMSRRSVDDIKGAALLLQNAEFDGRLRIDGNRCDEACLRQIAQISALNELSISVIGGPTDCGVSEVMENLDLALLRLERINVGWGDLTPETETWQIGDDSLMELHHIAELTLIGMNVDGSFLNSMKSPERLHTLHIRDCPRFNVSLGRFTHLRSVTIVRCPVGNETMRELASMPSLRRLQIDSGLVDDKGARVLLDIPLTQIRSLQFAGNVSQELRSELESYFLDSEYYEPYRFQIRRTEPF